MMLIPRTLALLTVCIATAHAAILNDTGITFCGDDKTNKADCATVGTDAGAYPRQDGTFVRPFSFTKIANNGTELPSSATLGTNATDWACTKDNVTGLIWEVKTFSAGLRSQGYTYTWYNSNNATNGGSAGAASSGDNCFEIGRCDTEKYVVDVNAAGLCGAADWRMPTRKELIDIVDYGQTNGGSIDHTYFPNTSSFEVWSSSPNSLYADRAWYVSFIDGHSNSTTHSNSGYGVRLVRGGQ